MKHYPVAIKSDIVVQESGDETLVYNLKTNRAFCLNETSATVWNLCDGNRTVLEISDEMSKRMKTLIDENIVWLALDQLDKDGLINGFEGKLKFNQPTRRETIKKIALTSAIALPIISSITAPKAANAQSTTCSAVGSNCDCPLGTGAGNTCGQGGNTGSPFWGNCPAGCLCRSSGFTILFDEEGICE